MGGGMAQFMSQLYGVLGVGAFVFTVSIAGWWIIKQVVGLRVSRDEELAGLDLGEHGNAAYPDFHPAETSEA
jgi:Amt family ammonium transporter